MFLGVEKELQVQKRRSGENGNPPKTWDGNCSLDSDFRMQTVYVVYALSEPFSTIPVGNIEV